MSPYTLFTSFLILALFHPLLLILPQSLPLPLPQQQHNNTNITTPLLLCSDKCGTTFTHIPYPFHLNNTSSPSSSCVGGGGSNIPEAFRLTCINSSSLFLSIGSLSYQVVEFFPDAVLVDFPNTTSCRQYNDLKSFGFDGNDYFGISVDNVVGLYDCEDSSLCKSDCEKSIMPACDGAAAAGAGAGGGGGYPACCYPLSDRSVWRVGYGFSGFSEFGCRGFSCWVPESGTAGKRGVKLEWGMPVNSTTKCAPNAQVVNATTVASGMRCQCLDGFVGDGFAQGTGCLQCQSL